MIVWNQFSKIVFYCLERHLQHVSILIFQTRIDSLLKLQKPWVSHWKYLVRLKGSFPSVNNIYHYHIYGYIIIGTKQSSVNRWWWFIQSTFRICKCIDWVAILCNPLYDNFMTIPLISLSSLTISISLFW